MAALGWGGTAAPTALQAPGQPRSLETAKEGPGWLLLDWKKATDGGKTAFYRIERRKLADGSWTMVGTALESEATLTDQERGKEFEYRVIAVNKAGESGRDSGAVTSSKCQTGEAGCMLRAICRILQIIFFAKKPPLLNCLT